MKKFGIVYLMLGFLLFAFIFTRLFPNYSSLTKLRLPRGTGESTPSAQVRVPNSVVIDTGESKKTYENIQASTPYLALVEAAKQDKLEVTVKQYDFGVLVEKIGDYANTSEKAWIFFVNGAAGTAAADKQTLQTGDQVEWRYVSPN